MLAQAQKVYLPTSIHDAVALLERHGEDITIVAGGTGLLSGASISHARLLLDLSGLGLSYIREEAAGYQIGAMTTLQQIVESKSLESIADGILCYALMMSNSWLQRNAATMGGTLASGSPWNEPTTVLLALHTTLSLGGKTTTEKDLFAYLKGGTGGLILEARIPRIPGLRGAYARLARTGVDVPWATIAATALPDRKNWTIVCGGIEKTPVLVPRASEILEGKRLDESLLNRVISAICETLVFEDDFRASAWYKREIVAELTRRTLLDIFEKLG